MSSNNDFEKVIEIDDEEQFARIVLKSLVPAIVDFWSPWCAPCLMQTPIITDCARECGARAVVAKVNVDSLPEIAEQFNIEGIPTIVVYKNGREIKRFIGVQSINTLRDALDSWV